MYITRFIIKVADSSNITRKRPVNETVDYTVFRYGYGTLRYVPNNLSGNLRSAIAFIGLLCYVYACVS